MVEKSHLLSGVNSFSEVNSLHRWMLYFRQNRDPDVRHTDRQVIEQMRVLLI